MADHSALAPIQLDDPAPFLIAERERIQHLLGRLAKRPELVCLYPAERREHFALSALLQVADDHLVFDTSPDERTNKILLDAPHLICVSNLDRIHIQFDAATPQSTDFDARRALHTARPESMLFVQRRDYFRLTVPARQPALCYLQQTGSDAIEAEVADISLGGLGLYGPLPGIVPLPGMRFADCRLELPEIGIVPIDLLVCATHDITPRGGQRTLRIGCRFMHLSGRGQTLVQRYINHLERSRITHE